MSGWKGRGAALVIDVAKSYSILLIPEIKDPNALWFDDDPTFDEIIEQTGVDEVAYLNNFENILHRIDKDSNPIKRLLIYDEAHPEDTDDVKTLIKIIGTARKVKFDWEIECMREATRLTYEALEYAIKNTRPGILEKEIEGNFLCYGLAHGSEGACFTTMAPSGENTQFPHYHKNNQIVKENSLV